MLTLNQALKVASPRLSPPPTPLRAVLIHGSVMAIWVLLFARAFVIDNVFAWSAGIVYVTYDTALLLFVFWQTLALLKPAATGAPSARRSIGVIVAAHNEANVLPMTLAARYGIAAPLPGTLSEPSPIMPTLRWLRLPHGGKAQALNIALELSRTDTVMTVDADTLVDPGGVAAMRRAFSADPTLVAATGVLMPVCSHTTSGRLLQWFQTYEYIRNFLSRYAWSRLDSLLLISGAFAGYRRQAVLDVGGFDDACLVEDYELTHRLLRYSVQHGLAWRTDVLGGATARTDAPSSIPAFLQQRRRWFGGFLQTQFWYRDMIGNPRYGWLGTAMLPVKAIDTLQPIYGLLGVALLVFYLLTGNLQIFTPVAGVILGKIALDLGFHLWGVHLYRRWVGVPTNATLGSALLSSIAEPFTFQILRHAGAASGWLMFLTGTQTWSPQTRAGLLRTTTAEERQ